MELTAFTKMVPIVYIRVDDKEVEAWPLWSALEALIAEYDGTLRWDEVDEEAVSILVEMGYVLKHYGSRMCTLYTIVDRDKCGQLKDLIYWLAENERGEKECE